MKKVSLSSLCRNLNLEIVSGSEENLKDKYITILGVNRGGLELSGYIAPLSASTRRRIIVLGSKESGYIQTLDEKVATERFENIFKGGFPTIVLSSNFEIPKWLPELANKNDYNIFQSQLNFTDTFVGINTLLADRLAPSTEVHGVLMKIKGMGILITGQSGVGKSETALELLKSGHQLVGDDRIVISRNGNRLIGVVSPILENLLEVRGIGIIDVSEMFGKTAILDTTDVDYVIHMKPLDEGNFERLGADQTFENILGLEKRCIEVPVSSARNIASLVETAVDQLILSEKGVDAVATLTERLGKLNG